METLTPPSFAKHPCGTAAVSEGILRRGRRKEQYCTVENLWIVYQIISVYLFSSVVNSHNRQTDQHKIELTRLWDEEQQAVA